MIYQSIYYNNSSINVKQLSEKIKNLIYNCFKTKKQWKRKELINKVSKALLSTPELKDQSPNSLSTKIKSLIGSVIATMLNDNILSVDESKTLTILISSNKDIDPHSKLSQVLDTYTPESMDDAFIKAINLRGGEFFEQLCVKVMEKYYIHHDYQILSSQVTGGANDNGVDGVINTIDPIGIKDKTLIQSKARVSAHVTLREVRYFYGSMYAEHGTRGIFMTNSYYHNEAIKFLNRLDNFVGIDRPQLIKLCKDYEIGYIKTQSGYILDKEFFLL